MRYTPRTPQRSCIDTKYDAIDVAIAGNADVATGEKIAHDASENKAVDVAKIAKATHFTYLRNKDVATHSGYLRDILNFTCDKKCSFYFLFRQAFTKSVKWLCCLILREGKLFFAKGSPTLEVPKKLFLTRSKNRMQRNFTHQNRNIPHKALKIFYICVNLEFPLCDHFINQRWVKLENA